MAEANIEIPRLAPSPKSTVRVNSYTVELRAGTRRPSNEMVYGPGAYRVATFRFNELESKLTARMSPLIRGKIRGPHAYTAVHSPGAE